MNNRKSNIKVPPFLAKLYDINDKNKDIVTWSKTGEAFILVSLPEFCEKILPYYFKHNNFASFVRQLNMYDFHKTKNYQSEQGFSNVNFRENRPDLLPLIKRKNQIENSKSMVTLPRKKKVDYETIKKEALNICESLSELKGRVESLEGKHSFLEICHSKLSSKNQKIKHQLNGLLDKEKNLENMLLFALKNFAPNFFYKNNDMKALENLLPDAFSSDGKGLVEKSAYEKNDILNKIFKEIKNLITCYYIVNNESDCEGNEPKSASKNKVKTDSEGNDDLITIQDLVRKREIQNEDNYYNKIKDLQNIFMNNSGKASGRTKFYPRKLSNIQIIENNSEVFEYNIQPQFEENGGQDLSKNQEYYGYNINNLSLSYLQNKRTRSDSELEKYGIDSSYTIEKKDD